MWTLAKFGVKLFAWTACLCVGGVAKLFITCTLFCATFDIIGAKAGLPEVSPGRSPHNPRSHQLSRNQLHSEWTCFKLGYQRVHVAFFRRLLHSPISKSS